MTSIGRFALFRGRQHSPGYSGGHRMGEPTKERTPVAGGRPGTTGPSSQADTAADAARTGIPETRAVGSAGYAALTDKQLASRTELRHACNVVLRELFQGVSFALSDWLVEDPLGHDRQSELYGTFLDALTHQLNEYRREAWTNFVMRGTWITERRSADGVFQIEVSRLSHHENKELLLCPAFNSVEALRFVCDHAGDLRRAAPEVAVAVVGALFNAVTWTTHDASSLDDPTRQTIDRSSCTKFLSQLIAPRATPFKLPLSRALKWPFQRLFSDRDEGLLGAYSPALEQKLLNSLPEDASRFYNTHIKPQVLLIRANIAEEDSISPRPDLETLCKHIRKLVELLFQLWRHSSNRFRDKAVVDACNNVIRLKELSIYLSPESEMKADYMEELAYKAYRSDAVDKGPGSQATATNKVRDERPPEVEEAARTSKPEMNVAKCEEAGIASASTPLPVAVAALKPADTRETDPRPTIGESENADGMPVGAEPSHSATTTADPKNVLEDLLGKGATVSAGSQPGPHTPPPAVPLGSAPAVPLSGAAATQGMSPNDPLGILAQRHPDEIGRFVQLVRKAVRVSKSCQYIWPKAQDNLSRLQKKLDQFMRDKAEVCVTGSMDDVRQAVEQLTDELLASLKSLDDLTGELRQTKLRDVVEIREALFKYMQDHGGYEVYPVKVGDLSKVHHGKLKCVGSKHTGESKVTRIVKPGYQRTRNGVKELVESPQVELA